ncbi:hypothetical protein KCU91_g91, partial [Aureobasidium melanogenum]
MLAAPKIPNFRASSLLITFGGLKADHTRLIMAAMLMQGLDRVVLCWCLVYCLDTAPEECRISETYLCVCHGGRSEKQPTDFEVLYEKRSRESSADVVMYSNRMPNLDIKLCTLAMLPNAVGDYPYLLIGQLPPFAGFEGVGPMADTHGFCLVKFLIGSIISLRKDILDTSSSH